MAYAKTTWADGDVITQAKLQNIEDGIAALDGASGTIPTGALTGGAGINATRDSKTGAIALSIPAKGVTAAMIADGVIPAAYSLPAAGTALGGVKKGAAVAAVAAANAAAAAGTAPTKAEYDVVVAECNANKTAINALIASLKAAGVIA